MLLIIYCPDPSYVSSVVTAAEVEVLRRSVPAPEIVLVMHVVPPSVLDHAAYRAWMDGFGPKTEVSLPPSLPLLSLSLSLFSSIVSRL